LAPTTTTNLCKAVPYCTEHAIAGRNCYPGKPKIKTARVMVLMGHNTPWPSRCEGKTVLVSMEFEGYACNYAHEDRQQTANPSARPNGGGNYESDKFSPVLGVCSMVLQAHIFRIEHLLTHVGGPLPSQYSMGIISVSSTVVARTVARFGCTSPRL